MAILPRCLLVGYILLHHNCQPTSGFLFSTMHRPLANTVSQRDPLALRASSWPLYRAQRRPSVFHASVGGELEFVNKNVTVIEDDASLLEAPNEIVETVSCKGNKTSTLSLTDSRKAPTVRQILAFCIPAVGIWLCGPLLSMIDTSTVGVYAGTAQQAALNPAVAVTDYSGRLLSFLYTGTTNLMASAEDQSNSGATARTLVSALQLAAMVGTGLGAFLLLLGRPMVGALIGNDGMDPAIAACALRYVRIRALGMPASALIGTAQAACLGMKDVKSPLTVIGVAALANLVLDLVLVRQKHALWGGAAGAAWATVAAQYFALLLFARYLFQAPLSRTKKDIPDDTKKESLKTRGLLAGTRNLASWMHRPDAETRATLGPYVLPVTTTQVGRCSTYIAMGHVVSSTFGTVSMAAHQIVISIFYALIPIGDSLSLTAQSFLPSLLKDRTNARVLRQTTRNLAACAGLVGLFLALLVGCIPVSLPLFSSDAAVQTAVRRLVPVLLAVFGTHGFFCGAEGILLAHRDLTFLGRMYAAYFIVVPSLMLQIKRLAATNAAVGLDSVWHVFLAYQVVRISIWTGRVQWLQYKIQHRNEQKE